MEVPASELLSPLIQYQMLFPMAQADRGCYVHKLCEICLNNKLFKCNFATSLKVISIHASEFLILDF